MNRNPRGGESVSQEMGRYKELKELRGKRGLGRKIKKQSDPEMPDALRASAEKSVSKVKSKLGGRIKQRMRKRTARMAMLKTFQRGRSERKASKKNKLSKTTVDSGSEEEPGGELALESVAQSFSDDNQSWLKPAVFTEAGLNKKKSKREDTDSAKKTALFDGGSDGNGSEEGEEGMFNFLRLYNSDNICDMGFVQKSAAKKKKWCDWKSLKMLIWTPVQTWMRWTTLVTLTVMDYSAVKVKRRKLNPTWMKKMMKSYST